MAPDKRGIAMCLPRRALLMSVLAAAVSSAVPG